MDYGLYFDWTVLIILNGGLNINMRCFIDHYVWLVFKLYCKRMADLKKE